MELLYSDQYVPLEKYGSGQLLYEIEKHDGTPALRWVKFVPQRHILRPRKTYVLIGGLQSGEWRYWALRWAALNGNDPSCKGVKLWSAQDGKPLGPILKREFGSGETVGIDVRFRYTMVPRHPAQLIVDEDGIPYDPKLRKRVERLLPKPKKLKVFPEYIVRPNGLRLQCLFAGLPISGTPKGGK